MADSGGGLAVGVDLGGTRIRTAVVDPDGRVVQSHGDATDVEGGAAKVAEDVVRSVRQCVPDLKQVRALGVGVAGQVDTRTGIVRSAPNLRWKDFPLGTWLEDALEVPVAIENDVRAITWGEWLHGAGRGIDDLVVLFVGTGVGGGIVSDGRVVTGDRGMAGEIGHLTLVSGGRPCTCGHRGCLEAYAGGWAIARRAAEAAEADAEAGRALNEAAAGDELTARHVSEMAATGDPLARRILDETGRYLGAAVVGLVHVLNPRRVVLGGGVIDGNPGLVDAVETVVRNGAIRVYTEKLTIRRSKLGAEAGVIGSASLALRRLEE